MEPRSAAQGQNTLLIESGNSRCKWAVLDNSGEMTPQGAVAYVDLSEPASLVREWLGIGAIERVVLASVSRNELFTEALSFFRQQWSGPVHSLSSRQDVAGLHVAYEQPEKLGVDRWLAMQAAVDSAKLPVCVVDCGTAMTIDVVSNTGEHLGGQIIPGLEMMRHSLHHGTGLLPRLAGAQLAKDILGRDTEACITAGTLSAQAGAVNMVVEEVASLGAIHGIITGGNAHDVLPLLHGHWDLHPHLVLEGMSVIVKHKMMGDAL